MAGVGEGAAEVALGALVRAGEVAALTPPTGLSTGTDNGSVRSIEAGEAGGNGPVVSEAETARGPSEARRPWDTRVLRGCSSAASERDRPLPEGAAGWAELL